MTVSVEKLASQAVLNKSFKKMIIIFKIILIREAKRSHMLAALILRTCNFKKHANWRVIVWISLGTTTAMDYPVHGINVQFVHRWLP